MLDFQAGVVQNILLYARTKNISRFELAEKLGMSLFRFTRILNKDTTITLKIINACSDILEVTLQDLLSAISEIKIQIFESENDRKSYLKELKKDNIALRNEKINFNDMERKRNFEPTENKTR